MVHGVSKRSAKPPSLASVPLSAFSQVYWARTPGLVPLLQIDRRHCPSKPAKACQYSQTVFRRVQMREHVAQTSSGFSVSSGSAVPFVYTLTVVSDLNWCSSVRRLIKGLD